MADEVQTLTTLTRANLLNAIKPRVESVDVAELGGKVLVRGLRASEVMEIARTATSATTGDVPILIRCVVNADGTPMLTDADLPALMDAPMSVLMPLLEAAKRLSGLGDLPKASGANT